MKVTAGLAGGIHIDYPKSARPTTDKVKQAIFSALYSRIGSFEGKKVLDMFAGSGALGIEALSRGAEHVAFLDKDKQAIEFIHKNIQNCKIKADIEILQTGFEKYQSQKEFDIIFLDPPYQTNLLQKALKSILTKNLAHAGSLIVCESDKRITYPPEYENLADKKYGSVYVSILKLKGAQDCLKAQKIKN